MADVTLERLEPSSGDGRRAGGAGDDSSAPADGPVDPRAVRVAVGPSSSLAHEPALVVAPPPIALGSGRPRLAGRGPLGGAARDVESEGTAAATEATPVITEDPVVGPTCLVDGQPLAACLVRRGARRAVLVVGEGDGPDRHRVVFTDDPVVGPDGITRREVVVDGWRIDIELEPERRASLRERARTGRATTAMGGPTDVKAIIPGRVVSVSVAAGDAVIAGQQILVVEAMKMQNELRAPRDGTIRQIVVAPGMTIEVGDLLLVIE
jgi:biotin carboxyl carrier protein